MTTEYQPIEREELRTLLDALVTTLDPEAYPIQFVQLQPGVGLVITRLPNRASHLPYVVHRFAFVDTAGESIPGGRLYMGTYVDEYRDAVEDFDRRARRPIIESVSPKPRRQTAHGGSYAVWVTVTLPDRKGQVVDRLGKTRLQKLIPQEKLDHMAGQVGGPVWMRHSLKRGQPVIYIRARYGTDFRAACEALWRLVYQAFGGHLNVWDSTEHGAEVIRRGIIR